MAFFFNKERKKASNFEKMISFVPMKTTALLLWSLLTSLSLFAQTNEEEEHTHTFVYGLNFNTNGGTIGGANLRFSQIVRPRWYRTIGLEVVAIKHPQEKRVIGASASSFIFGKQNYLYSIRPLYGFDYLIFKKAPEESVQVTANFAVGPSFGIEIPYYIVVQKKIGTQFVQTTQPYNYTQPISEIQSVGALFAGLSQAKIIPGFFVKAGISLEFGEFRNNLTGIEVGFTSEFFSRAPNILAPEATNSTLRNKQYMLGAYLTLFLGSRR